MSNFHALTVTVNARINNIRVCILAALALAITLLVVGLVVQAFTAARPSKGYLCPSVDGVVGRIYHVNKVGRPYFIDGKRASREEYQACKMVELPHP